MTFASEVKDSIVLLSFKGDLLGEQNNDEILEKVNSVISQNTLKCAVNLSDVRYMNSTGIGVLITLLTKFRNKGGELVLIKPSDHIKKLLLITKLNSIFTIVDDESSAIGFLKASK